MHVARSTKWKSLSIHRRTCGVINLGLEAILIKEAIVCQLKTGSAQKTK